MFRGPSKSFVIASLLSAQIVALPGRLVGFTFETAEKETDLHFWAISPGTEKQLPPV
jgi:hypothetical protein